MIFHLTSVRISKYTHSLQPWTQVELYPHLVLVNTADEGTGRAPGGTEGTRRYPEEATTGQ